jgi:hypothetical protein
MFVRSCIQIKVWKKSWIPGMSGAIVWKICVTPAYTYINILVMYVCGGIICWRYLGNLRLWCSPTFQASSKLFVFTITQTLIYQLGSSSIHGLLSDTHQGIPSFTIRLLQDNVSLPNVSFCMERNTTGRVFLCNRTEFCKHHMKLRWEDSYNMYWIITNLQTGFISWQGDVFVWPAVTLQMLWHYEGFRIIFVLVKFYPRPPIETCTLRTLLLLCVV